MNLSLLLTAVVCPIAMAATMVLMMRGSRRPPDPDRVPAGRESARGEGRVLYVRNLKEGPIRIWVGGVPHRIGGRGFPGDVIALPGAALQDPDLAGYLELHWIEEVDRAIYRARSNAAHDETARGNGTAPTPTRTPTTSRPPGTGER